MFEGLDPSQVGEIGQEGESNSTLAHVTPLTQALTYTGDVQVCAPTQIDSVPRGVPRWTTEQEEHLKVYSRKRGDDVVSAPIGSVPRWTR